MKNKFTRVFSFCDGNINITRKTIEKFLNAFFTCKGWKLLFESITIIIISTRSIDLKKKKVEIGAVLPKILHFFPLVPFAWIHTSMGNFLLYNFCLKTFSLRSTCILQFRRKWKKTRIFNWIPPPISKRIKIAVQFVLGLFLTPARMSLIFLVVAGFISQNGPKIG